MTNRILNWKFLSVRGMFSESLYWEWRIRRFWRLSHYCQAERSLIMGLMSLFVPARQPETWLDETWGWWWMVWPVDTRVGAGHWDLHQLGKRRGWGEGTDWIWLQGRRNCFLDCLSRSVSHCSQDMFPRLCHNMIPWISTWLELGENNSHILICNKFEPWHKLCLVFDQNLTTLNIQCSSLKVQNSNAKLIWIIRGTCHISYHFNRVMF